jgi:hypothetical protein
MRQKIKFSLIENARDSLEHAVEHFCTNGEINQRDYKRILLDISQVIELLLKEKLLRIHPAFIWNNIDQYPSTTSNTISTKIAIDRLERIAQFSLPINSKKTIIDCRTIRNQIEHYKFEFDKKEADAIIGRLLSFIFHFSRNFLNLDWEKEFRKNDYWESLINMYDFWKAHSEVIENELNEKNVFTIECPICGANTLNIDASKCEFCGHHEEIIECESCKKFYPKSELSIMEIYEDEESYSVCICKNCQIKED